jgi:hypothetical protein
MNENRYLADIFINFARASNLLVEIKENGDLCIHVIGFSRDRSGTIEFNGNGEIIATVEMDEFSDFSHVWSLLPNEKDMKAASIRFKDLLNETVKIEC